MKKILNIALVGLAITTTGCQTMMRPQTTSIQDSINEAAHNKVIETPIMFTSAPQSSPGSLWKPGAKHFFKDSRARQVGDMVTVLVSEATDATTEAKTKTTREHDSASGITNLLNLEGLLTSRGMPPGTTSLLDTDSTRNFKGEGKTEREDSLSGKIAAIVTQVLPNGYLVIQGKRELVVNYELKEMGIQGIVRPEDISAENTIESNKIAEARIFYAGRGLVDETQTPSYGVRFFDKVLPF